MNSPLEKKKLFRMIVHLFFGVLSVNNLNAQACNFLENDSIQLNINNQHTAGMYTQRYALTSASGQILAIETLPSFPPHMAGNYLVYALYRSSFVVIKRFVSLM